MRTIFMFAFWLCCCLPASSQAWYKFFNTPANTFSEMLPTPNGYWVQGAQNALEIAPDGKTIGWIELDPVVKATFLKRNNPNQETDIVQLLGGNQGYFWRIQKPDGSQLDSPSYPDAGLATAKPASDSAFYLCSASKLQYFTVNFRSEWTLAWEAPYAGGLLIGIEPLEQGVVVNNGVSITRFDRLGQKIWEKSGNFSARRSLRGTQEGIYAVYTDPVTAKLSIFLLDLDTGAELKRIPLPVDKLSVFAPLSNGDFAGASSIGLGGTEKSLVFRMDAAGNVRWQKEINFRTAFSMLADSDGAVVVGFSNFHSNTFTEAARFDADGNIAPRTPFLNGEQILENNGMGIVASPTGHLVPYWGDPFVHIPKDSATGTLFETAPIIGGIGEDGNLYLSAATYSASETFQTGYSGGYPQDFNRVWLVKQAEVERLRTDFALDSKIDAPLPDDIRTWPARNNRFFEKNRAYGDVRTPQHLFSAPFKDVNGDGDYNPYEGDYPLVKGDQMAWWVMTDSIGTLADTTFGKPLQVDIAFSLYTYDCGGSLGDQVFFLDYLIRHRGNQSYKDTYLGQWADFDIGCAYDDYVGSMPDVHTMYAYNMRPTDGDAAGCLPINNYGDTNVPLQTTTWLNKPMQRTLYINNASGANVPFGTGDPATALAYYRVLRGFWPDGTPYRGGGDGKNGNFGPTDHVFPGNPSDPNAWSACSANLAPADRRAIGAAGPMLFNPGDTLLLQTAFMYHQDIPLPCPDVEARVKPTLQSLLQGQQMGALHARSKLAPVTTLPVGATVVLDAELIGATAYQWSNGGTTSKVTVSQPGTYTVTITRIFGCPLTLSAVVQTPVSATHPTESPFWAVSPNPVYDHLTLSCPNCTGAITVNLYAAQGMLAHSWQGGGSQTVLALPELPSGLYWMSTWHEGIWLGCKKVVKQ